jgi:flagellar biosynthesis/type III secretory pathway M-ring protein FliF/YscJ
VETVCSIGGLYIGQLGLKSSATVDRDTIRKYVYYLSMLAAVMIVVRILWVADVVILAKKDLKERHEEEDEEEEDEEEEEESKNDMYDDYYGDAPQISDKNFLIYFAIQVRRNLLPITDFL